MPRKTRTVRRRKVKGGYYGMTGAVAPGAPAWGRGSEMGDWAVSSRGGNTQYGAKRRGRKHLKKTHKKKRGGSRFGAVSASFPGTGSRGIADTVATNTKFPPFGSAQLGAFNNGGAQPGSGYASFIKAH